MHSGGTPMPGKKAVHANLDIGHKLPTKAAPSRGLFSIPTIPTHGREEAGGRGGSSAINAADGGHCRLRARGGLQDVLS
jgi:hypothetical protein